MIEGVGAELGDMREDVLGEDRAMLEALKRDRGSGGTSEPSDPPARRTIN